MTKLGGTKMGGTFSFLTSKNAKESGVLKILRVAVFTTISNSEI